ncbi:hypothetical protein SAMD00023353_4600300 [Rosellinia necatrix]|uniref:DUF7708 domain-containing protein n=1 Tax=Rosellinia necatrix TaxID=77044 RepID=A0A1S8A9H9_ROSNE|nr:hypothetical protein SAMD00023353_4600300 [Rosellinia necatrix]
MEGNAGCQANLTILSDNINRDSVDHGCVYFHHPTENHSIKGERQFKTRWLRDGDSSSHLVKTMKKFVRSSTGLVPVKLTDPAQEFVCNRVTINENGSMQSGARGRLTPIPSHQKLASSPPTDAISENKIDQDVHCKQFADVLRSFEESLPNNIKTRFDLQAKHTWSEVINEAKIAEMKYNNKANKESPFGRVRGLFRILRSNSPAMENWLGLLPTESAYGSLICGGLKVILRAATRMDEVKEFVVQAIAAIPEEIEKAQLLIDYTEGQDTNRRLYNSVSSLYCAVFDILNDIIAWYKERSARRQVRALLQQSTYEKKLEEKVDAFKGAISAVKSEAEICGFRRLQIIDERTREFLEVQERLVILLRSNPRLDHRTVQWRQRPLVEAGTPARKRKSISRRSLCEAVLRYDEEVPGADITTIMRGGGELSLKAQDTVAYVIESAALKAWLLEPKNAALLIRGNSEELDGGISAVSFVSAHIVQSIERAQRKPRLISLCWFAKQHQSTRSDADANVHGVMRSLIGQLVNAYSGFDLYFVKRSHAIAVREGNDIRTLCDIFDNLVFQLPKKTTAICVIDWLACLQYRENHEAHYLVQRLLSIVRHPNADGGIFKLLLTHAGGTFEAASVFIGRGDILEVPEDGNGKGMGSSKLMWDTDVDGTFGHLVTRSKQ